MASDSILNDNVDYLVPKTNSFYDDYDEENETLGKGVSGKVVKCIHKETKTKYALKKLDDCVKARREINLHWCASKGCRHIVQIKDVYANIVTDHNGKKSHKLFLVTELMNGGELFYKIINKLEIGRFTERDVAKMMFEIGSAVHHLHTMSIVHRDLKPENLLLTSNDDDAIIKICDFGFAKDLNNGGCTTPDCYTPYYVAPEILKCKLHGANEYDIACDIWSLGVIMYILIRGKPPFSATPEAKSDITEGMKNRIINGSYNLTDTVWKKVSDEAKSLIKQMLETNPQNRLNIDQVMSNVWIQKYIEVPQTPLADDDTLANLKVHKDNINKDMTKYLDDLRTADDNNKKFMLKKESNILNKLFKKRNKK